MRARGQKCLNVKYDSQVEAAFYGSNFSSPRRALTTIFSTKMIFVEKLLKRLLKVQTFNFSSEIFCVFC